MMIDHVIMLVDDFDAAGRRLLDEFGLAALPGGLHPMGTRNTIVPLKPPQYLELLGIGDRSTMENDPFGRLVLRRLARGAGWFSWAIRADDIEAVAARTGQPVSHGSIVADDGTAGSWRLVLPPPDQDPALPFFIQYDRTLEEELPLRQRRYDQAGSPARPGHIRRLVLGGDDARLREWIGTELPVRFAGGDPGLHAVAIESQRGELLIP